MPNLIRSYLGDAADRLTRFFRIDGRFAPALTDEPPIVPVVIVGDATLPGYASVVGRRFAQASNVAAGNGLVLFKAIPGLTDGLIVEGFSISCLVAGACWLRVNDPTTQFGLQPSTTPGTSPSDRKNAATDTIPMAFGATGVGATAIPADAGWAFDMAVNTTVVIPNANIFLQPGAGLQFGNNAVGGSLRACVWGRVA